MSVDFSKCLSQLEELVDAKALSVNTALIAAFGLGMAALQQKACR